MLQPRAPHPRGRCNLGIPFPAKGRAGPDGLVGLRDEVTNSPANSNSPWTVRNTSQPARSFPVAALKVTTYALRLGGQEANIKGSAGPPSLPRLQTEDLSVPPPASGGPRHSLAADLPLPSPPQCYITPSFSVSIVPLPFSSRRTLGCGLRAQQNTPGDFLITRPLIPSAAKLCYLRSHS